MAESTPASSSGNCDPLLFVIHLHFLYRPIPGIIWLVPIHFPFLCCHTSALLWLPLLVLVVTIQGWWYDADVENIKEDPASFHCRQHLNTKAAFYELWDKMFLSKTCFLIACWCILAPCSIHYCSDEPSDRIGRFGVPLLLLNKSWRAQKLYFIAHITQCQKLLGGEGECRIVAYEEGKLYETLP